MNSYLFRSHSNKPLFILLCCCSLLTYCLLNCTLITGWMQDREAPETLADFYSLIAYSLKLSDLFQLHGQHAAAAAAVTSTHPPGGTSASASVASPSCPAPSATTQATAAATAAAAVREGGAANPSYVFRGLICYYGKHYVSIFQSRKVGMYEYLLFDDQTIKVIGDWEAVKDKCVKSCYQPVLLLYELETTATAAPTATVARVGENNR